MHTLSVKAWHAGVDYLRMTYNKAEPEREVEDAYHKLARNAGVYGSSGELNPEPRRLLGYEGVGYGNAFYGKSRQGLMFQASGKSALYAGRLDLEHSNVPRLDVQVTCWLHTDWPGVAATYAAVSNAERARRKGGRWAIRHINGMGAGDTCYIGTRGKKSRFIRIYDKWRESKEDEYKNAWRFEVELTDDNARYGWMVLKDAGYSQRAVASIVEGYLIERGVNLPDMLGIKPLDHTSIPKDEGSDDRRIAWLKNQVAPAIHKLVARGYSPEYIAGLLFHVKQGEDEGLDLYRGEGFRGGTE